MSSRKPTPAPVNLNQCCRCGRVIRHGWTWCWDCEGWVQDNHVLREGRFRRRVHSPGEYENLASRATTQR